MMPQLYFPGDLDLTVSFLDEKNSSINICIFNHVDDASNIYADKELGIEDIKHLINWLQKEVDKHETLSKA